MEHEPEIKLRLFGMHPHWQGELRLYENGRMARLEGDGGGYELIPRRRLVLQWDRWPAEILEWDDREQLYRNAQSGFNLRMISPTGTPADVASQKVRDGHLGGYLRGGDPLTYTPRLWDEMLMMFEIRSVIDVGCGEGHSTRYFLERGLRVKGVDGCCQAIADSQVARHVALHDYTTGPYIPRQEFDLAWCCEFVEHVDNAYVDHFLATFARCRYVAMTHALPGQRGYHHVNCQRSEHWIGKIEAVGFEYLPAQTNRLRLLAKRRCYARASLLVFQRRSPRHSAQAVTIS